MGLVSSEDDVSCLVSADIRRYQNLHFSITVFTIFVGG